MKVLHAVFPGLQDQLRPLERHNLIAGVTVTAYLVPQVMAYAVLAGLSPVTGLWAALVGLPLYALLGTSRWLSIGPESSVAVMTAASIVPVIAAGFVSPAVAAAALAVSVGLVGVVASVLRLSFVADLFSKPILVGYMAGIAILMIDSQMDRLFGANPAQSDTVFEHVWNLAGSSIYWPAALVALLVFAVLVVAGRSRARAFGPIAALTVAVALAAVAGAIGKPVEPLGDIPTGLPAFAVPSVGADVLPNLFLAATGVLLVAFADATLTGRSFHQVDDPPLRPTTELRALGLINVVVGFFQGMPVSTSGSRSAVSRASGATDQGYSLVAAVFLAVVLLVAGPLLEVIPLAALGALVVYAAVLLIDVAGFRRLWRFRRSEFFLAVITTLGVLIFGVLYGVLIAVALSVLLLLVEVARPHAAALGYVPDLAGMHDITDFPNTHEVPGLLIFRYDSPLIFANADNFLKSARTMTAERMPGLKWFALQCEAIIEVDATGVDALQSLADELQTADIRLVLVRAKTELLEMLGKTRLLDEVGADYVFPTLPTLVEAFERQQHP